MTINEIKTDFLVIGSGIAGLWFAYRVADFGTVTLVTKKEDTESNTNYAQGGIAAVMGENDTTDIHINDTIKAGNGLANQKIVQLVVENGPKLVKELYEVGIKFSTYKDMVGKRHFDLGKEGGHTRRRIVHCQDQTGVELEKGLIRAAHSKNKLQILENHFACDLLVKDEKCFGAMVIDSTGNISKVFAKGTLLATGGIGSVYLHTTNPPIATGDGIAMVFRAGCQIANMEFIQFHPTSLYGEKINGRSFLISEAVRGEGGILKTQDGKTFVENYHELGSLAPRDIVARAIDAEMKKRHEDYVFLDVTHLDPDQIRRRFPNIYNTCLKFGIDITKDKIPVVPAAHYVCGGVKINEWGETNIKRLFAAGECACSGMHGANRLASNSLLEALFFAESASERCRQNCHNLSFPNQNQNENFMISYYTSNRIKRFQLNNYEKKTIDELVLRLRKTMWENAGIVRSNQGLQKAEQELATIKFETESKLSEDILAHELLELKNMLIIAKLITTCSARRKESRGLHYNIDYPNPNDLTFLKDTIITQDEIA
jgi:L-aspartate oxidase